jgi:hypothetical protein
MAKKSLTDGRTDGRQHEINRAHFLKIADFHVLGLLIAEKHDLSKKKKFRLSRAIVIQIFYQAYSLTLKR